MITNRRTRTIAFLCMCTLAVGLWTTSLYAWSCPANCDCTPNGGSLTMLCEDVTTQFCASLLGSCDSYCNEYGNGQQAYCVATNFECVDVPDVPEEEQWVSASCDCFCYY